jgi:hypothetical protein
VQQMKEGNDTNALMLLRSPMYEMTWVRAGIRLAAWLVCAGGG